MFAIPVDHKGPTGHVVPCILERLEEVGHVGTRVTLKSDGEESIVAVKREVAIGRKAETPLVESPVRESKCNGAMENAIRRWQSKVRVLRKYLENCLKTKVPNGHPLIEWLMVFAADAINIFHKKALTGRSMYEEVIQHKPKHAVVGFGEQVMFTLAIDKTDRNKFDADHATGIGVFLGWVPRTTECIVMNRDGIIV